MGILRDGQIADVGKCIIDGNNIFDANADPEINLQRRLFLSVKVGFLLQISDSCAQRHNFFIAKFHSKMRVNAHKITSNKHMTFPVKSTIEVESESGVKSFAHFYVFADTQKQLG